MSALSDHRPEGSGASINHDSADPAAEAVGPLWRLESLQVVNWGTFEGHWSVPLDADSTLISGASGSGKSTLLDAYTALMQTDRVAFNSASNDTATGRARDASRGRRTLLTYLRGKVGDVDEGGGAKSITYLRGRGKPTWGAVGATWVSTSGEALSATRVYYVAASDSETKTPAAQHLTYFGRLDLSELDQVMSAFTPGGLPLGRLLPAAVPGLQRHENQTTFRNKLFKRLGIGDPHDPEAGDKALQLLERVQSARPFSSVNDLYRDLVLDTPPTFKNADLAIKHFDILANTYQQMQTEAEKARLLGPIVDIRERLEAATTEADELDAFGLTQLDEVTPVTLWSLRTESRLLETAVADVEGRQARNRTAVAEQQGTVAGLKEQANLAHARYQDAGGGQLDRLDTDIEKAERERDFREETRVNLANKILVLGKVPNSKRGFDILQSEGTACVAASEANSERRAQRSYEVHHAASQAKKTHVDLETELEALRRSPSRMPPHLRELRTAVAAKARLSVEQLPFLAELIDIREGQEEWRTAIETVLGGDARRLLVPADRFREFSTAINDLSLRGRITFASATAALPVRFGLGGADDFENQRYVAGKLAFADHPFAGWIQDRLTRPTRNARCVIRPQDLDGAGFRVTLTGQTRNGTEGAHGRNDKRDIIGFTNDTLIAEIEAERDDALAAELAAVEARDRFLATERIASIRRDAFVVLAQYRWEQVDVDSATSRIAELTAARDAILTAEGELAQLRKLAEDSHEQYVVADLMLRALTDDGKKLDDEDNRLVGRWDQVRHQLVDLANSPGVMITHDQTVRLDTEFKAAVEPGDPAELSTFTANLARLQKRLTDAADHARAEIERSEGDLVRIFHTYQDRWVTPNLTTNIASYEDYRRILDEIETGGLYKRKQQWRRQLTEWSGEDLVPLSVAITNAVAEIDARIDPINDILAELPFGARRGRLRIKVTSVPLEPVRVFLRELRDLAGIATREMTDEQLERRFADLEMFMTKLRDPSDAKYDRTISDRARLLDVRRHVHITAHEHPDPDAPGTGVGVREYNMLGETSGGETQELVAFVLGSALRFRLGDEFRDQPRFAPVFLDEGFVKADAQFAGRAVQAWKQLGFQLIIGTPEDKVTGLERHIDSLIVVIKDPQTNYSSVIPVPDAPITGTDAPEQV